MLWLEREVKGVLGSEIEVHGGVLEAMSESGLDDIYETVLDPNYRSKNLRFTKTNSGWEGRMSSTILGGIGLMFFGSIFLVGRGLMMGDVTRDSLLDLAPWIREAVADASSSGDSPPVWFAMIFGGAGLLVVLIGLFSLGLSGNPFEASLAASSGAAMDDLCGELAARWERVHGVRSEAEWARE